MIRAYLCARWGAVAPRSRQGWSRLAPRSSDRCSVAGPTGQVANTGTGFVVSNGTTSAPAAFIFDTLDGHIEAWNPTIDPLIGNTENKASVPGASYTGLALASTSNGDELFAANFGDGRINIVAEPGRHFENRITGQVVDESTGKPFTEPGLWGLLPGTASTGGTNAVWFTSGINHEQDGLLGVLRP
jgi:hypothetical protein